MAVKAVQALVTQYRQIDRKICRIREETPEKEALSREREEILSKLKQIFEQCDNILGITKEYRREIAVRSTSASDLEIGCWD